MRTRVIHTLDELQAVFGLVEKFCSSHSRLTGRDFSYYAQRFSQEYPMLVALEDDTGIIGFAFGTLDRHISVVADEFIHPSVDSPSVRARLIEAVAKGAEQVSASLMAIPANNALALAYEEIGFSPTLFVQLHGPDREKWRQALVCHYLRDYRILELITFQETVSQAIFHTPAVDAALLDYVEDTVPACRGSLYMMNRWIGAERYEVSTGVTEYRRPRYMITYHPRFRKSALSEVNEVDPHSLPVARPDSGVTMISAGTPGHDCAPAFRAKAPTFVRHLAPVKVQIRLDGTSADLDRLVAAIDGFHALDSARSFSVQCRKGRQTVTGPHAVAAYTIRDIEIRVGSHLEANGFIVDIDDPEQVVSIYLHGLDAHIGFSRISDNVSRHADEYRRRGAQAPDISRAEHKLHEALEVFDITVFPGMRALDLGAAPGGWTKALVDAGATVTAVDPANLSPLLAAHPRVTHLRCRIEELSFAPGSFDLIVNDMVLEPEESAALMCAVAECLAPDAPAVITLKLPVMRPKKYISQATAVLEHAYDVIAVRHLFHNRQEVTVYLVRRETLRAGWEKYIVPRGVHRSDTTQ